MSTTVAPSSKHSELVSVVLSFRNEEAVIPEVIRRLTIALNECDADYEMIFVNDDSSDRSLEILREHAASDRHIRVVTMSRRFGVGECLIAGLERARGDAIVYLDCDLQDPPELIPKLVDEWRKGADVVYTVRARRLNESRLKLFVTRIAYQVIRTLSEVPLAVDAGDFRLLSRQVVRQVLRLRESDPYIRGITSWVGFRQVQVNYERHPRKAGHGHFPLLSSTNPAKSFMSGVTSFSMLPLYAIFVVGSVTSVASSVALIAAAMASLFGFSRTFAVTGISLLFLWGTLMTAVGIVGIYVSRVYKDVRQRPRFIVSDMIGFSEDNDSDSPQSQRLLQ
jgi:polyisoprenyl-phosphate glycosyltransferase